MYGNKVEIINVICFITKQFILKNDKIEKPKL